MTAPSPYERLMPAFTAYQSRVLVTNFGGFNVVRSFADLLVANSGDSDIAINTDIVLTANITITKPLWMLEGGTITTNGYTLTINAPFNCGAVQCFITSGAQVVFGTGSTLYVLQEWFGAVGDGSTSDSTAVQLTYNRAAAARLPVIALSSKTYRVSGISVPTKCRVQSDNTGRSYAVYQSNAAGVMFTLANSGDEFNTFKCIQFDGSTTATASVKMNATNYAVFEDCAWVGGVIQVDSSLGEVGSRFNRCEFNGTSGTTTELVKISLATTGMYFDKCTFGGTTTYGVRSDTSWTGDDLIIRDAIWGCICTDMVKLERNTSSGRNVGAIFDGCRLDGGPSNANFNIGQYVDAIVKNCQITAGAAYSIICDGLFCQFYGNMFSQSTTAAIAVTSNAQDTYIGKQIWGSLGGGTWFSDAGARTIIEAQQEIRKGTTAQRPSSGLSAAHLLSTQVWGPYLDTTLDADGKPIWWNNTAWVDATGAVV